MSKLFLHTRDDVPSKPVVSCETKPTTGNKLWTKKSPLGNLGVTYCVKLLLKFCGTKAGLLIK